MSQADVNRLIDELAPAKGLDPALVKKISYCEDRGNPYAVHPNIRKGEKNAWSIDYGPLQVNDYYHAAEMKKAGQDIHNPKDALIFGLNMMQKQGTTPWNWSKPCWSKK